MTQIPRPPKEEARQAGSMTSKSPASRFRWIGIGLWAVAFSIVASAVIEARANRYVVVHSAGSTLFLDKWTGVACSSTGGRCFDISQMSLVSRPKSQKGDAGN